MLLAHPGTQHSFRLAQQLHRIGDLARFWTGAAYVPESFTGNCICKLPSGLKRLLANRRLDSVPNSVVHCQPFVEFGTLLLLREGLAEQQVMFRRNLLFQLYIPERHLRRCSVVVGFDTSSWLLAERAAKRGLPFLLEQTTGHPLSFQRLVPNLQNDFPDWADDFPARLPELQRSDSIEHNLSRYVVVASLFSKRTLLENGVPAEKIIVNPCGVDSRVFTPSSHDLSRPLRFVFVGSFRAQKGLPLLLKAWRSLSCKSAELWLVGHGSDRHNRLIGVTDRVKMIGKVPHHELPMILRQCDVLVLPSYFEGFGLVLLEAMACGLPIIATDATSAPDLITDGVEGYVIPVGDLAALVLALERFIDSPANLKSMALAARSCAERNSWEAYGDRWQAILQSVF